MRRSRCRNADIVGIRLHFDFRPGMLMKLGMHLLRRPGTGEDVGLLAVYLASDESSWVTGQNYSIDGGVTAGFR